jgi:hypothetical protein
MTLCIIQSFLYYQQQFAHMKADIHLALLHRSTQLPFFTMDSGLGLNGAGGDGEGI